MIEAQSQTTQEVEQVETPKVFTTSQILEDLDNGLDRKAIATKYGLNQAEMKVLFEHPVLKGKRAKRALKKVSFTLIDDTKQESTPCANHDLQQVEDNTSENLDNEPVSNFNELND